MSLKSWWLRSRASRGYGVHSPLAFKLVGNVIRPPRNVAYYGEEKLLGYNATTTEIRRARLLLRFVAEMGPSAVWTPGPLPDIFKDAVSMAGCVVRIYEGDATAGPDTAQMTVVYGHRIKKAMLRKVMTPGRSLIGFSLTPAMIKAIVGEMKGGVVLEWGNGLIAVNTSDESIHYYQVKAV